MPIGKLSTVIVPAKNYQDFRIDLIRHLQGKGSIAYLSVNRGCLNFEKILQENGLDMEKIKIADVTETMSKTEKHAKICIGWTSPKDLNQLLYFIDEEMKKREDIGFVVLDSITSLLIYNDYLSIVRFMRRVSEKLISQGKTGVFVALKEETKPEFYSQLAQATENLIEL